MSTLLSLTSVTIRNVNDIIFEDLNFQVKSGEHWALVGRSGSGKSALLEAIAGKLSISKGEVEHPLLDPVVAAGREADPLFNWHRLVAYVSARHHFRSLSNTSNFYYQQRYNSSDSEDAVKVEEYIERIGTNSRPGYWTSQRVVDALRLAPLMDKQLIKLSNGETKRLLIAAALLKNPVLLLLDNPLTGLDVAMREYLNKLLLEIGRSGIHMIIATSPSEVPDVVTHVATLDKGKVVEAIEASSFSPAALLSAHSAIDAEALGPLLTDAGKRSYETIVGMRNVVVRYGERTVLEGVDWLVKPGERWALLGHNGAGKSTLLSLINGDNPQAYANDIVLFDKKRGSGESIWDIKRNIGFVSPELFQYFPNTSSCLQVIESGFYDTLGLFRPSDPARREVARAWMRLLRIEQVAGKLLRNVSASTQRLCLLARALVKNPPLLIFDEPCQGLDAEQQDHFKRVINSLCRNSDVTLIYVSHYQNEIPEGVSKWLVLEDGRVRR